MTSMGKPKMLKGYIGEQKMISTQDDANGDAVTVAG